MRYDHGFVRLPLPKFFFTIRMMRSWHRLPTEVVGAPSLQKLGQAGWGSEHPDVALGAPVHCRGVGQDGL